jgi:hypothetical protein
MGTSAATYTKYSITWLTPPTAHAAMEVLSHWNIFFSDALDTNAKDKRCARRLEWFTIDIF